MSLQKVTIKSGGKLTRTDWHPDNQEYVEHDIDCVPCYLFYPNCEIEEGVTLRDIFLLIERDIELYSYIFNTWVEEITEEALSPSVPWDDDEYTLDYLQLYQVIENNEEYGEVWGTGHVDFQGIAKENDIPLALGMSPANQLADYPVIIGPTYVCGDVGDCETWGKPYLSLAQILFGIVWELTWYGPPELRDKRWAEISEMAEGAKLAIESEDEFEKAEEA